MIEIPRTASDKSAQRKGGYKVRVLGVGGAGLNILSRVAGEGGDTRVMAVLDTDSRALKGSRASVRFQLGSELTHGLGCGGDPEMGREASQSSDKQIRELLQGSDLVFLCVGLGGGTGSGAAPVIARIAREEGAFVIAAVTLPFHFEGRRRQQQALDSLSELRSAADTLLTFENDKMEELIVPATGVQEAFAASDRTISQAVRAITILLDRPGLIRVGLDDLLAILNGKDAKCCFGFGEAEGADRAVKATEEAIALLSREQDGILQDASSVLVHLAGDHSVTFSEVETVTEAVANKTKTECKVLLGVSASKELGQKLSVALISSTEQVKSMNPGAGAPAPASSGEPVSLIRPTSPKAAPQATGSPGTVPPLILPKTTMQPPGGNSPASAPFPNQPPPKQSSPSLTPLSTPSPPEKTAPGVSPPSTMARPNLSSDLLSSMGGPAALPGQQTPSPAGNAVPPMSGVQTKAGAMPVIPPSGPSSPSPGMASSGSPIPPLPASSGPASIGSPTPPVSNPPPAASHGKHLGEAPANGGRATGKGRFEGTESTQMDGVDLDVPTFLRKKRSHS